MQIGKTFVINASDYATIQSAVDAAELLPESDSGLDSSGVLVLVPGGNFSESVTIRKNVNLVSFGGFITTIENLYILPKDISVGPKNLTVSGLWVPGTIYVKNQTSNDSGIFNPDLGKWSIVFKDCTWSSIEASNICNIETRNCYGFGDQSFLNCPAVNMYSSTMTEGTLTFTGDSQLPNQCSNLDNEEYILNSYSSYIPSANIVTVPGSSFPAVHNDY